MAEGDVHATFTITVPATHRFVLSASGSADPPDASGQADAPDATGERTC